MSGLTQLAAQALRLAERQAQAKARRTALKLAGGAVAGIFFCIAVGFAAFGGFLLLAAETGPVTAAFLMALLGLLLAILALLIAQQVGKSGHSGQGLPPELHAQLDTLSREAGKELGRSAPYIVAAGFIAGFLSGKK